MHIALEPTLDAVNSGEINFSKKEHIPGSILVPGLAGAEVATLQVQQDDATWIDVKDGVDVEFSATLNNLSITAPGIYRVAKGATAAPVGVYWMAAGV